MACASKLLISVVFIVLNFQKIITVIAQPSASKRDVNFQKMACASVLLNALETFCSEVISNSGEISDSVWMVWLNFVLVSAMSASTWIVRAATLAISAVWVFVLSLLQALLGFVALKPTYILPVLLRIAKPNNGRFRNRAPKVSISINLAVFFGQRRRSYETL